ncbi:MAG TPA: hypothetical protein VHR15_17835 [Ktedonobacterales bacterium]|jgi:hypothetical protein|nr:hypothetical protein [Ktedonobacterales bacterium]
MLTVLIPQHEQDEHGLPSDGAEAALTAVKAALAGGGGHDHAHRVHPLSMSKVSMVSICKTRSPVAARNHLGQ